MTDVSLPREVVQAAIDAIDGLEPLAAFGRVGTRDIEQAALQKALAALRASLTAPKPEIAYPAIAVGEPSTIRESLPTYTHEEVKTMLDGIGADAALWGLEVVSHLQPGSSTMGLRAVDQSAATKSTDRTESVDQGAWLIEHSGEFPGIATPSITWTCVQPTHDGFGAEEFGHTHDASKALRFARKEDAAAVMSMILGPRGRAQDWFSKPYSVREHMWPAAPSKPAQKQDGAER